MATICKTAIILCACSDDSLGKANVSCTVVYVTPVLESITGRDC